MGVYSVLAGVLARLGVVNTARPEYLRVGRLGEDAAAAHLVALDFRVIARNARVRMGEADIVAQDGDAHVIVEVKSRVRDDAAPERSNTVAPEQSVTRRKMATLRRIAAWLAQRNGWATVRIDVVAVEIGRVEGGLRVLTVRHLRDVR